jgi:hypothetical protein
MVAFALVLRGIIEILIANSRKPAASDSKR